MTTTYHQKPQPVVRQSNGRAYYRFCHHIDGWTGQRCCAPTENGRHACPECLAKERTIKNLALRDSIKTYI